MVRVHIDHFFNVVRVHLGPLYSDGLGGADAKREY
jgi:hypothetical protein